MSILHKLWKDYPDTSTPLNAAALMDLEDRQASRFAPPVGSGVATCSIVGVGPFNSAGIGAVGSNPAAHKAVCRVAGTYTGIRAAPHGGSCTNHRYFVLDSNKNIISQTGDLGGLAVGDALDGASGNLLTPLTLAVGDTVYLGWAFQAPSSVGMSGLYCLSAIANAIALQDYGGANGLNVQATTSYAGGTLSGLTFNNANFQSLAWMELVP